MFIYKVIAFALMMHLSLEAPQRFGPIDNFYENRDYSYKYAVKDAPTNNYHSRFEEKRGDLVTGEYTVLEPSGELRVVQYYADHTGFHANIDRRPFNPIYEAGPNDYWRIRPRVTVPPRVAVHDPSVPGIVTPPPALFG